MDGVELADAAGVSVPPELRRRAVRRLGPTETLVRDWILSSDPRRRRGGKVAAVPPLDLDPSLTLSTPTGGPSRLDLNPIGDLPGSSDSNSLLQASRHPTLPAIDQDLGLEGWQEDPDLDLDELGDWVPEWACRLSRRELLDMEAAEAWRALREMGTHEGGGGDKGRRPCVKMFKGGGERDQSWV